MPTTPPDTLNEEDTPLLRLVFQEIAKNTAGSIPFSEYMELVLYHPDYGYYSDPKQRAIGREGDFFTSVSVGETFGFLLAEQIRQEWEKWGDNEPVVIVEQGAHDGQLARDIVNAMRDAGQTCDYRIVEPRDRIREWLEKQFREEGMGEISFVPSFKEAKANRGIFLCNELLDAFPFRRLVFDGSAWKEMRVGTVEGQLAWVSEEVDERLAHFSEEMGSEFEAGYETEVCLSLERWISEAADLFEQGLWWVIDYGYESSEYFSPSRTRGTLRCYRGHRASEDPFEAPGRIDITAHVNFTHLINAAESTGLMTRALTDQHHFLISAAREWLLSIEGAPPSGSTAKQLRQFQTLTHPSMMGQQFKVAQFSRGI